MHCHRNLHRCLKNGASVIGPTGKPLTAASIGGAMATRAIMADLRAGDYRQVLIYWILSYAKGLESGTKAWAKFLLLNSRLNRCVYVSFDELIAYASGGLSRVEVYEYIRAIFTNSSEVRK